MDTRDRPGQSKVGIVLTGGGARAAYQVGVLRAIAEMLPADSPCPFPIICGTSAGAINATVLAINAGNFRRGVRQLITVWKNFHVSDVYRADPVGVLHNSAKWISAVLTGGLGQKTPVSLLDNSPLAKRLSALDFGMIQRSIDSGKLYAFSITCSGYTSGESVTFFQGSGRLEPWQRARRIGVPARIGLDHLMASSALPFIFPPLRINREYFGDGSMRQIAPVSPALHLGADRLFVIGVGRQLHQTPPERIKTETYPSLAQIAGHCLNSIFLDSLEVDLERLQRINRTLAIIPREVRSANNMPLQEVDFRVLSPSEALEKIALQYTHKLPRTIRALLFTVGALRKSGSNLVSYLLFEREYCRALIKLGYTDTMHRREELMKFFGYEACWL